MYSLELLVLGQMPPDGVAPPPGRGLAVLDDLLGTFVDTAQALIALCCPDGFAIPQGNGMGRAVAFAQTAAVAAVPGKEGLGASGKFIEPEIDKMGLCPGQSTLVDPVHPFLPLDLPGNLLQFCPGSGDLLENLALLVGVRANDVVAGHHQAITAAEGVELGKLLHGKACVCAAGADAEGERLGLRQLFCKVCHDLRCAPGVDREYKADLPSTVQIRQLVQGGNITGHIPGEFGQPKEQLEVEIIGESDV